MRCGCCLILEKKIILSFVLIFSKVVIIFFLNRIGVLLSTQNKSWVLESHQPVFRYWFCH